MEVQVNLVGVLLATISSIVVGMVWYAPKVFGNTWLKLEKIDPKKGSMSRSMGLVVVSSLVMAYVLAHVTYLSNSFFQNSFMQDAITTAFWMWLGFQGLRYWMHNEFNQVKPKATLIHVGNDLVTILVMGVIIGAFQP